MAIHGSFALIGKAQPRHNRTFPDLALDGELAKREAQARCGLMVIDLRSGDIVHWVRLEGVVQELYDDVVLPGVTRPMALGPRVGRDPPDDQPGRGPLVVGRPHPAELARGRGGKRRAKPRNANRHPRQ